MRDDMPKPKPRPVLDLTPEREVDNIIDYSDRIAMLALLGACCVVSGTLGGVLVAVLSSNPVCGG